MKLSEVKTNLEKLETLTFQLPNGELVPSHFHVTEVGKIAKNFIDCGGTVRNEEVVNFQLWEANDYDHRLHPEKLVNIIELSERILDIGDHEVEVEYQGETIGKYGLEFNGKGFLLTSKTTSCLAQDKCGIPQEKQKVSLAELSTASKCAPGGGCCQPEMAKNMVKESTRIFNRISEVIDRLPTKEISEERKNTLQPLIEFIQSKVDQKQTVSLNFICTHNSRRSHLSQVWAQTMARYFDVPNVFCFSGGTEATALFPVVAETLEKIGFEIEKGSESKNPQYSIKFGENELPIVGFSKVYDDPFNPQSSFAAIMTCSQADQDCPMILGAERRIAVAYDDPKMFDGTPFQREKYEERSLEIASEMYYVFSRIEMRS